APAAPAPPKPAAKPAAPKPAAPTASAFDDLPAPAGFDDLPAPAADDAMAGVGGPPAPPPPPPPPPSSKRVPVEDLSAELPNEAATEAPVVKVKKKRNGLRIALVVIPTLALAGGALSLTPAGPYGYFAITDALNRKGFEEQLATLRTAAREALAKDTSVEAEALANQARTQQEGQIRFAPVANYTAVIAFSNSLRFGKNSELEAVAKTLLDGVGAREDGPLRQIAIAGRFAVDGKADEALSMASNVADQASDDIDMLALAGEIALLAKKADAAQKHWSAAAKVEKNARTLYGLARALLLAGNDKDAVSNAEEAIKLSASHAGARTLIASTMWTKDSTEARAKKLLDEVVGKGPVRSGASTTEVVRAYNMLGYIHLRHSQQSAAEKSFGEALKIDSQSEEALVGNGELLYEAGRFSDSLARFEAAKSANPNSLLAAIGIAKVKMGQELVKEALSDLQALNERTPDPLVGYWLGRAYLMLGKRDDAEKVYRKAVEKGGAASGVVRAYVALADLLASRAKPDEAAKVLEEAATKLPNSFDLHMAKGEVAINASRLNEAKDEFGKALAIDDQNLAPMFKLGVTHRKAREYDDAKAQFEKVAAADTNYPGLALEWGLWYSETGKTEDALKMYQDALAKAPEDIDLKLRVGSTQVLNGQSKEAIKHLEDVYTKRRGSPDVNYFLGRAYLDEGDASKGLPFLRTAARNEPNRADYQLYLGWAAGDANQASEAERAIEAALELDATLADAYWQRGLNLQRKGKVDEALKDLLLAVEKKPDRFEAYAALAICYGELTQQDAALDAWRMAVAGRDIPEWHYRFAKLLLTKGTKEEAAEHLEKAVDGVAKMLADKKLTVPPPWAADANYQLGEVLRGSNKERAIKAFREYLKFASSDDAYRKDAASAITALGGRLLD
ncbi:MAG: tetratricopeptide repeat protein, partial [Deltaproteobacteria bacterium]|nr:tetratricopeptide repeat protein [Deltaproteobacteria bacterium]